MATRTENKFSTMSPEGEYGAVEREDQKVISAEDTIKTGLQIERTWFKWLFTGLHIGSYGTWVIKFFAANDGTTLFIVIASWIVAFGVILFGLEIYYNRRRAVKAGMTDTREFEGPFAVVMVTVSTTAVLGGILLYVTIKDAALQKP